MWGGSGRVTHQEPLLSQSSWDVCSCPGRRNFHLGTEEGETEGSSRLQGAPTLTLDQQGDSNRDWKRRQEAGTGREKERHRNSERNTERKMDTERQSERCRETQRLVTRDRGKERDVQRYREKRQKQHGRNTQRPRESQKERDTQQPVPAKIVGSPELRLLPVHRRHIIMPGRYGRISPALRAWRQEGEG